MVRDLDELYFSQLSLLTYEKCPLKFRYRYFDGLFWPQDWGSNPEQKEFLETGNLFHQLARRYYARGETINEELLSSDLKLWYQSLKKFRPYNNRDIFLPEYELRINRGSIKLLAKFDLLYLDKSSDRIFIYDWKTNKRPFSPEFDQNNHLQTLVYLYVLQEALDEYLPEVGETGLIYWNPRFPDDKRIITYSKEQFKEDELYLGNKIREIKELDYNEFHTVNDEKLCKYCEYRSICFNKKPELIQLEEDDLDLDLDWESIEEIEF